MAHQGKIHLTYVISAPPDQVAEGDRIFKSHGPWIKDTHHRSGNKALLSYNVSKAPELTNPMDTTSAPTGNTIFVSKSMKQQPAWRIISIKHKAIGKTFRLS